MKCKICDNAVDKLFERKILGKYTSGYYQCRACRFIQTDEPFWLNEAYQHAITSLDLGLVNRNIVLHAECVELIDACFPNATTFLDYAGGYGMFVRMMRDSGFNFYRQDVYCENLFAKHFDIEDSKLHRFDLVTAFEVLEHFENPLKEIAGIFQFSDNLIFSTKLVPDTIEEIEDWWYLAPETGQHIAFYHRKTMESIALKHGKKYYFNGKNLHLFTSENIPVERLDYVFSGKKHTNSFFGLLKKPISYTVERRSLLDEDFRMVRAALAKKEL